MPCKSRPRLRVEQVFSNLKNCITVPDCIKLNTHKLPINKHHFDDALSIE